MRCPTPTTGRTCATSCSTSSAERRRRSASSIHVEARAMAASLDLAFGLCFEDLYATAGLGRVDAAFVAALREADPALARRLIEARGTLAAGASTGAGALPASDEAALLIELGPHVDAFVARLFGIDDALDALRDAHARLDPLYEVKLKFVKREAMKLAPAELAGFDADAALRELESLLGAPFNELAFARAVLNWQRSEADPAVDPARREFAGAAPALALRYSAWAASTGAGPRGGAGPRRVPRCGARAGAAALRLGGIARRRPAAPRRRRAVPPPGQGRSDATAGPRARARRGRRARVHDRAGAPAPPRRF